MAHLSWNRQLALATVLFGLGTATYWLEYKHRPEKETLEENEKKLFQVKDQTVKSISITEAGKNTVFSCLDLKYCKPGENSKWEILEPAKLKADDANVNALLSSLNSSSTENVIDLKEESPEKRAALLKEYGLSPQARQTVKKVMISTDKGDTILYMGNVHPIGESFFAAEEKVAAGQKPTGNINENRVYLVPNFFKSAIEHDLKHWRDKKLLTLLTPQIASFDLVSSKGGISGSKKDGHWTLNDRTSKQSDIPGDSESIESFLNSVVYLTAQDFVADQKTDPKGKAAIKGLKPALSLTLTKVASPIKTEATTDPAANHNSPSEWVTLAFYSNPTKLFATVSNLDPVFSLEPSTKGRLDKTLKDFRMSKLVTTIERFSAKRLEFTGKPVGPSSLVLAQTDGKWLFQADKMEADPSKITRLLEKLSDSRILDFVSGAGVSTGEPEGMQLTLGDEKNPARRHFVFWKKGNQLYARDLQSKRKEVFLLDASFAESLPWEKGYFSKAVTPVALATPAANPPKK
jgi:hypothetical protein